MHNVSLRHPDLPFSGGSSIGDWRGTEVRQYTASCLVKMLFCFVRCLAHKPNRHPPSVCAARFQAARSTTADAPEKSLIFPSGELVV